MSDPTTLPLWGVLILAAAMYPLGMMLGSPCSPCCTPCGCPVGEQLPDAVIVTFSGLTKSAVKTDSLLSVELSACFGSGAAATVQASHGLPGAGGAITGVTLTSGGSGYAVLGRVEPTGLTVSASGGSGAEFFLTLAESADECELPFWEIASVTVTKAGEGYSDNQQLSVSLGTDEFEAVPANITLQTLSTEPTLEADVTATEGTGLQLSVTTKVVSTNPSRWGVNTISVVNGGSGYGDKQAVVVTPAIGETTASSASAIVRVNRVQPNVVPHYYGGGTGATFAPTLTKTTYNGDDVWQVASVSVSGGGSGYANNENVIFFSDTLGENNDLDSYWKIVTNGSGAVVSLTKTNGGRFWASSGVVASVEVSEPGSYYGLSDAAGAATVIDGGRYYKERADIPPHVASVTATILQTAPSAGSGAVLSVTVDDNPASPTFGQLAAVAVDDGGNGYLEWSYASSDCCVTNWNGKSILVPRSLFDPCVFTKCCGLGSIWIKYNGQSEPPEAKIVAGCALEFAITSQPPFACDGMTFTGVDPFGTGTMSISAATGTENPNDYLCPGCCSQIHGGLAPAENQCTKEDCIAARHTWQNTCACECGSPSPSCIENASLIVDIESVAYLAANNGGFERKSKNYTLTLDGENGWSNQTGDFEWAPPYANQGQGAAANFLFYSTSDYDACRLYVIAYATDKSPTSPGYPGYCWQTALPSGLLKPAGIRVPFENGCFVDGSETDCIKLPVPWPGNNDYLLGAHIVVAVVTS